MADAAELAGRLRQAVQGCTGHIHGPVQAWVAVEEAVSRGEVTRAEVAARAITSSTDRIAELCASGVAKDDMRYIRETTTAQFIGRVLLHEDGNAHNREPTDGHPADPRLDALLAAIVPERDAVLSSPLYQRLTTMSDVRVFTEHHVFAVWDFMCLLKALQRALTCVSPVWLPVGDAALRRLVNEIVIAEESDVVDGEPCSHFELYLGAMREIGADTTCIEAFVRLLARGTSPAAALEECGAPLGSRAFVKNTMELVYRAEPHAIVAAFAIGREQTIPAMFRKLIASLHAAGQPCAKLLAYLDRHVSLDGDEHGPAALGLLTSLCGDDDLLWHGATIAAREALSARDALWRSVLATISVSA